MALSDKVNYEVVGHSRRVPGKAAASDNYYPGAMLVFDGSGYLAAPSDSAGLPPAGVYTGFGIEPEKDVLEVGSGDNPDIEVEQGLIWVPQSGSQSDVGTAFYVDDDDTLTTTAGSKDWQVLCVGYKSGYLLIDFAHPMKA